MPESFNFNSSYKKPEEALPPDVAQVKAHPEMVGFDAEAMRKKLEEQSTFEFDENSDLGQMERMARHDEIDVELKEAKQENKNFLIDFERGIGAYYKEVALRPEKSFQEQFQDAFAKARNDAEKATSYFEKINEMQIPIVTIAELNNFEKKVFVVCEEGVFYRVTFQINYDIIDLNEYGFPGKVLQGTGQIVLTNNAGVLPFKNNQYDNGYAAEPIYPRNRYGVSYIFKKYTKEKLSLGEVKNALSGKPGAFKDLFEQVKAQVKE